MTLGRGPSSTTSSKAFTVGKMLGKRKIGAYAQKICKARPKALG